jgi:hypothetical protein
MTKVSDKPIQQVQNQNLKNLKSFRGGKTPPGQTPAATKTPLQTEITDQAKLLNAKDVQQPTTPEQPEVESKSSSDVLDKASSVAKSIAKAPVLPIILPSKSGKISEKIDDKKIDNKKEDKLHFIKKPALIFIEGFSAFGISNGDGIKDMAENMPGAKRFSWEEHDKIMSEIKKHAPDQPVVLVGHSFGGDTAIEIANELNSVKNAFRPIDLIVSIDAVGMNKTIIPQNVKRNLNFFGEGILPFVHGDPTVARNTKYTDVTNELRTDMHSKMEDNPEVQFQIFEAINETLGNAGKEDIFIEISEAATIKDVLEALKESN